MKKITDYFRKVFKNSSCDDSIRDFLAGNPVAETYNGTSTETAMKYTAVFSCVRVLAETLSATPIFLYRRLPNGDKQVRTDLNVYDILRYQPNEEMSAFSFKEICMMNLNLGGNAVSEKIVNSNGDLIGLYPYQWENVRIDRDSENKLIYIVKNNGEEKVLQKSEVLHIPGLTLNGVSGLTPLEYIAKTIVLGLSYESFSSNFYKNGAHAGGVIQHPNELSDVSFDRLKKEFARSYQGLSNTGKPIILEGGASYQPISIKPADAQLIENKKFQIEDIARIYRVPLHLIQNLDRATNNNIEHQSLEFVMYTMLPWFKRWEESLNIQLLTKRERKNGFFLEFKVDSLLRGDAKSRAEAYATGRQWGWFSVNDIRKLENLNSIDNGDIYLQPMNMVEAGGGDISADT